MSSKDIDYVEASNNTTTTTSSNNNNNDDNLLTWVVDYFSSKLAYLGDDLQMATPHDNHNTTSTPQRKYPLFEVKPMMNETSAKNGTMNTVNLVDNIHIVPSILHDLNHSLMNVNWNQQSNRTSAPSTTTSSTMMAADVIMTTKTCFASPEDYEIIPAMLCSSLFVLGVVYILYGYRCFRAISFITGLIFGSMFAYSVLVVDHRTITLLFPYGNVIASLAAGLALALLSSLVIALGLFIMGLNLGTLLGVIVLIVIYLLKPFHPQLQQPLSSITMLIFLVAISLVGSFSTLYFSKGCTIIATSLYGSGLALLCVDYFVENFRVLYWVLDQMSNGSDNWNGLLAQLPRGESIECLGTQIILAAWPVLTLIGIIVQVVITARGVHYDGYGLITSEQIQRHPARRPFPESPVSDCSNTGRQTHLGGHRHRCPDETQLEQRHKKYRYLYQVRTAHGDVISQNKKLCLPEQDSYTFNSDLSSHFMPSESRTTTLSVA